MSASEELAFESEAVKSVAKDVCIFIYVQIKRYKIIQN